MSNVWVGPGVINFGGKDYGFGEELPANIKEATLDSLRKKGLVSDSTPAATETAAGAADVELTGKLKAAADENAELILELEAVQLKNEGLTGKLDAAEEKIGELEMANAELQKAVTELSKKPGPGRPKK